MSGIYGELLTFTQEDGSEVQLKAFGNEHYSRYEDAYGYTVIYDEMLGKFCYADLPGNRLVSTEVTLDQAPPGVARHLEESSAAIKAQIEEHMAQQSIEARSMHEVNRTFGPSNGLLNGRQLSIGSVRGLTILVNFADVTSSTIAADVERMTNGPDYTDNGNISSVRDYFLTVSNGKLDYTNTVVGPYTLSRNQSFYINNLLVEETLALAVADGVDLSEFDSQGQGIIDALNILYAGRSVYRGDLWPHNSFINLQHGAIRTNLYLLTGLGRNPAELSIGTFCHENGHLLCRFPDMYDYGSRDNDDQDSSGIGRYCLMGSGNHLDFGRSPAPVCGYLRDLAGWVDNVVDLNTDDTFQVDHGDYGTIHKYRTSTPNEYFIVENRFRTGLDRSLPASGLAIYHCDTLGSNEYQQGTANRHYQCALLQADGRRDLENDPSNQGDSEDLYGAVAGAAITSLTTPHTREWDRRDSGLVVSDISRPGDSITFRVGEAGPSLMAHGQSSPSLAIPDNNFFGISDSIEITASGIVSRIQLDLQITHTYIGDLIVQLVSPTGARDVLHAREGGSADDLIASYDSDRPGEMSNLVGRPMQGPWALRIADRAGRDIGKLDHWEIEIESAAMV